MICGHVFWSQDGFTFDHVPLSCVPPWTSHDWPGLIATSMNCSEFRFLLMWVIRFGIRDNSRWHARVLPAESVRSVVHWIEVFANAPSVRITPPSEPSKIWAGLFGLMTIVCWSGWIAFGA